MEKKSFKYGLIALCVILSIVLYGCKSSTIDFKRESPVQEFMKNIEQNNTKGGVVKNSSGTIILKDSNSNNSYGNIQFGPKDINFGKP